jgi:TonB family protein
VLRPLPPPALFVAPVVVTTPPAKPLPAPRPPFPWTLAYAAGLLVSVGRLAYGYWLARRLLQACTRIPSFDHPVYESARISVPLTIAGKILLPIEWRTWDSAKLDAVLIHERTHVRRSDWTISTLAALNRCVYWFHPLAWWLEAYLRMLAEQASDDASLAHVPRESYAQALIDMAAAVRGARQRVAWEAMAMAKGAEVRMRIERVLDDTRPLSTPVTRARFGAMAVAAIPVIFLATVATPAHVRAQQQPVAQPTITRPADDTELNRTRVELNRLAGQIQKFKTDNQGGLPEQFHTDISGLGNDQMALGNADEALTGLQQQKLQLETQLTNFNNQLAYYRSQAAIGGLQLAELNQRIRDTQSQIATLQESYTEAAPQMQAAKTKLAALEKQRDMEPGAEPGSKPMLDLEGAILLLKTQIQGVNAQMEEKLIEIRRFNELIAQYQTRYDTLPKIESQYAELMRQYQTAQPEYERLVTQPSAPRLISRRDPEYAPEAREAGLQGKVELSVTVGSDGVPQDVQVIHGLGSGLDEKAIECVKQWRFQPAMLRGNTVPAIILVEVGFRLQ